MIDPISVGMTKEYSLKDDKINPTIWLIGPLDSFMKAKIIKSFGRIEVKEGKPVYVQGEIDFTENNFDMVRYGLRGFKNFKIGDKEVEFKTNKQKIFDRELEIVSDEVLKMIPLNVINELASEIWGENQVNEELEKN